MSAHDRRRDLLSAIAVCERYGQTDMAAAYAAEIRALDQHDNGAGTP